MESESIEFVKLLGEGSFGCVAQFKCTCHDGSSFDAAVKTSQADAYDYLQKEIHILNKLDGSNNIVRCLCNEVGENVDGFGNTVYQLSLEYAPQGCLLDFMEKYPNRKLPVPTIRVFTAMILEGLVAIHDHGYVHCDLKPENLLVFPLSDASYSPASHHELKICDFGNALEVGQVPDLWSIDCPYVGTPIYMPPESIRDGVANQTRDLWSLGCVVLEMFTGEKPWDGVGIDDLTNLLLEGKAPEIPESVPCDAREFIETCFSRNPKDRTCAQYMLSHHFLIRRFEEERMLSSVVEEKRESEEDKTVSDIVVVEETKEMEDQIVSDVTSVSRRDSSLLSKLKLDLRIKRAFKKWKAMDVTAEKRPLKVKKFPLKALPFKKRFLRMPSNSLDFSLVSVV